jgi:hypothetical protein
MAESKTKAFQNFLDQVPNLTEDAAPAYKKLLLTAVQTFSHKENSIYGHLELLYGLEYMEQLASKQGAGTYVSIETSSAFPANGWQPNTCHNMILAQKAQILQCFMRTLPHALMLPFIDMDLGILLNVSPQRVWQEIMNSHFFAESSASLAHAKSVYFKPFDSTQGSLQAAIDLWDLSYHTQVRCDDRPSAKSELLALETFMSTEPALKQIVDTYWTTTSHTQRTSTKLRSMLDRFMRDYPNLYNVKGSANIVKAHESPPASRHGSAQRLRGGGASPVDRFDRDRDRQPPTNGDLSKKFFGVAKREFAKGPKRDQLWCMCHFWCGHATSECSVMATFETKKKAGNRKGTPFKDRK